MTTGRSTGQEHTGGSGPGPVAPGPADDPTPPQGVPRVAAPEPRLRAAVELVRSRQCSDGRWLAENTHPGAVHVAVEADDGQPGRWNTLRALRVLTWFDGPHRG